jgi:hypothetical protein
MPLRLTRIWTCAVLVAVLGCGCAKKTWTRLDSEAVAEIDRIAVVAGEYLASGELGIVPFMKALTSELKSSGRFRVRTYRDILKRLESPYIGLTVPMPGWHIQMDESSARSLGEELEVDALCVVWMLESGSHTGDHVRIQLFSSRDGRALGCFETSRGSFSGGSYSLQSNAESMARETADALLQDLH